MIIESLRHIDPVHVRDLACGDVFYDVSTLYIKTDEVNVHKNYGVVRLEDGVLLWLRGERMVNRVQPDRVRVVVG